MITIFKTIYSTAPGSRGYLFLPNRLFLKSRQQSLSKESIELLQYFCRQILTHTQEICTQRLVILNNSFFILDLVVIVSIATATAQYTFHYTIIKSLFGIQAVLRTKYDQKIPSNILKLGKSWPSHISTYVNAFIDKSKTAVHRKGMQV